MRRLILTVALLVVPYIAFAAPWWETTPGGSASTVNSTDRLMIEQGGASKTATKGVLLQGMATDSSAAAAASNAVGTHTSTYNHSLLHSHINKTVIDKITESNNLPLWNGQPWPGSTVTWADITGKPVTFAPASHGNEAHGATFLTSESDPGVATHESTHDHTDMSGVDVGALEKIGESAGSPTWNGLAWPSGTGEAGDMYKSTYDINLNGVVDLVDAVPWSGITSKPSTFTPAIHKGTHATGGTDAIAPADIGAATSSSVTSTMSTHTGQADPHPGYMLESNIGTGPNQYPALDSIGRLPAVDGSLLTNVGTGDMLKSAYDADNDLSVDLAESVPWSGVTSKPTTFAPTAHKTSHATGGADAMTAGDIGAATTTHLHTGTYDPAGTASTAVSNHLSASDPHSQYVQDTELTVGDLVALGLTFHFRADAPICNDTHPNHQTAHDLLNITLGISDQYIACDTFGGSSLYTATMPSIQAPAAIGTVALSAGAQATLTGIGMTAAVGDFTVAAVDDAYVVLVNSVLASSSIGTVAIKVDNTVGVPSIMAPGQIGTFSISASGNVTFAIPSFLLAAAITAPTLYGDSTPSGLLNYFADVTGATTGQAYETTTPDTYTVAGIDTTANVSITGGEYKKNAEAYTANAGSVVAGDTIRLKTTAAATADTPTDVVLTVGGAQETWTVRTASGSSNFQGTIFGTPTDFTITGTNITVGAGNTLKVKGTASDFAEVTVPSFNRPFYVEYTLSYPTLVPQTESRIYVVVSVIAGSNYYTHQIFDGHRYMEDEFDWATAYSTALLSDAGYVTGELGSPPYGATWRIEFLGNGTVAIKKDGNHVAGSPFTNNAITSDFTKIKISSGVVDVIYDANVDATISNLSVGSP